jgi:hypothetical protein
VCVCLLTPPGTAYAIYFENITALIAFWVVLGVGVGVAGFNYVNTQFKDDKAAK